MWVVMPSLKRRRRSAHQCALSRHASILAAACTYDYPLGRGDTQEHLGALDLVSPA